MESSKKFKILARPEWAQKASGFEEIVKAAEDRGYLMTVRMLNPVLYREGSGEIRIELKKSDNGEALFLTTEDESGFPGWIASRLRNYLNDPDNSPHIQVLGSMLKDSGGYVTGRYSDHYVTFLGLVTPDRGLEPPDYVSEMLRTMGLPTPNIEFTASPGCGYVDMLRQLFEENEQTPKKDFAVLLTFFDHDDSPRGESVLLSETE
jgi:hypothetical protein